MPIYLGRLVPTSAEILIAVMGQNSDNFLQTCVPTVASNGVVKYHQNEPYVLELTQGVRDAFRSLDYSQHEETLRTLLATEQKHIWLGTGRLDQFAALKNIFGSDVATLSMSYDESFARYAAMDFIAIAKYYGSTMFDNETVETLTSKIPQSFYHPAEIEFNLADMYDFHKVQTFLLDNFNEEFTGDKLSIWSEWREQQDLLRMQYESN